MNFKLELVKEEDLKQYKLDMQEAFQKGFEDVYGKCDGTILPEEDVDSSLNTPGAIAYKAMVDGKMLGGAIVVIDDKNQYNHLHILYVKYGVKSNGIGKMIWDTIEELHNQSKVWETCTPYFDKKKCPLLC
jgi:hypothetical protein